MDVRKTKGELQEAKDPAIISGKALKDVKEALCLLMDLVNKARLFYEHLGKEEKMSHGHIIHYLSDHARKMDRTREQMKLLVGNLIPERIV